MAGPRRAIMVMGKVPTPGRVKTRLTPPLDPLQAARLASAMLRDTLLVARSVEHADVTLVHPPAAAAILASLVPAGVTRLIDNGRDLGDSMQRACQAAFAGGAGSVVLIGADLPTLPRHLLDGAFAVLDRHDGDVVLGPAADGGYYLIGLASPQPTLFEGIAWSTERVLAETLAGVRQAGLRARLLATWHDIDQPADLERLIRDLTDAPADLAPATRAALATIWPPNAPGRRCTL